MLAGKDEHRHISGKCMNGLSSLANMSNSVHIRMSDVADRVEIEFSIYPYMLFLSRGLRSLRWPALVFLQSDAPSGRA
jgi:hypothetical protein